jgi:PadR family transcriptional regulator, regulatory protein AphA
MARVNKTRFAILGFLLLQPMSGYDMKKFMMQSTNHFWMESDGQLYPILHKLIGEGLITSKEDNNGARKKNVYSITDAGIAEFRVWMDQTPDEPVKRIELSLKTFFGAYVPPSVLIKHIEKEKFLLEQRLDLVAKNYKELDMQYAQHPAYSYWKILLKRGELISNAELQWTQEALEELKKIDELKSKNQ